MEKSAKSIILLLFVISILLLSLTGCETAGQAIKKVAFSTRIGKDLQQARVNTIDCKSEFGADYTCTSSLTKSRLECSMRGGELVTKCAAKDPVCSTGSASNEQNTEPEGTEFVEYSGNGTVFTVFLGSARSVNTNCESVCKNNRYEYGTRPASYPSNSNCVHAYTPVSQASHIFSGSPFDCNRMIGTSTTAVCVCISESQWFNDFNRCKADCISDGDSENSCDDSCDDERPEFDNLYVGSTRDSRAKSCVNEINSGICLGSFIVPASSGDSQDILAENIETCGSFTGRRKCLFLPMPELDESEEDRPVCFDEDNAEGFSDSLLIRGHVTLDGEYTHSDIDSCNYEGLLVEKICLRGEELSAPPMDCSRLFGRDYVCYEGRCTSYDVCMQECAPRERADPNLNCEGFCQHLRGIGSAIGGRAVEDVTGAATKNKNCCVKCVVSQKHK